MTFHLGTDGLVFQPGSQSPWWVTPIRQRKQKTHLPSDFGSAKTNIINLTHSSVSLTPTIYGFHFFCLFLLEENEN